MNKKTQLIGPDADPDRRILAAPVSCTAVFPPGHRPASSLPPLLQTPTVHPALPPSDSQSPSSEPPAQEGDPAPDEEPPAQEDSADTQSDIPEAPDFTVVDADGNEVHLSDFRGTRWC